MVIDGFGLQTTDSTWYLAFGLLILWALSLPLVARVREGWTAVITSLPGLCWLAFGIGVLFRFFLLSYDAVTYGDRSTRLIERSSTVVDMTLLNAGAYWISFVAGVWVTSRLLPLPDLLAVLGTRAEHLARSSALTVAIVICAVCTAASVHPSVPASLVTPLALVGSTWVVPATIAWVDAFGGAPTRRLTLVGVLLPGALRLVLAPYREQVLVLVLVPFTAAVWARRRMRMVVAVPVVVALAFLSTTAVSAYRTVVWSGSTVTEALARTSLSYWEEQPYEAPWMENLRRLHVFDSLMMTVDLVPDPLPFSRQNVLLAGVTRGVVPRLLDSNKPTSDEGLRFQMLFWSYDYDPNRETATAAIAPSMPGSLYEAGGTTQIALGALMWAALLASIERLKSRLGAAAAGLHTLCALQALLGIERDYVLASSTLIQTLVVFFGLCFALRWAFAEARVAPLPAAATE